jgi:hypothetical protein
MPVDPPKVGELFSRQYLERRAPTRDSTRFRTRLAAYIGAEHQSEWDEICSDIVRELGIELKWRGPRLDLTAFFRDARIADVLSAVTLIWRLIREDYTIQAERWRNFVARALREENLGYRIDEQGGIHFFVDEEFERNRMSALLAADAPRYAAVRAAFEAAHSYLDAVPPDTKASVRSMFEALEILAKLMEPGSQRLNRQLILEKLRGAATRLSADAVEVRALEKIFDGFANWVDAMHLYRHGQVTPEPVAPSLALAVYALSSGAATLRLLLGIDTATERLTGTPADPA